MRADEALKASKDGYIYLNGIRALIKHGILHWYFDGTHVHLSAALHGDWQPSRPVELCEACKEAEVIGKTSWEAVTIMAAHLREYHCTCKKEA